MHKTLFIIPLLVASLNLLAQEPVIPTFESDPVLTWNGADDAAIWIHPTDPASSFFIGADKNTTGRLELYNMDGTFFWGTPSNTRYNNVDVMYNYVFNGDTIDMVIAGNNTSHFIDFYRVDADNRTLIDITGSTDCGFSNLYGFMVHHDLCTEEYYAFLTRRTSDGYCYQYRFFNNETGGIDTELIRIIDNLPTRTEGMVADYMLGHLYIAEESMGIWKYQTDPESGNDRVLMDSVSGPNLSASVEGLTIYYSDDSTGYLISASQGASDYQVYTREEGNEFLGAFELIANDAENIDAVIHQDGIDVLSYPIPGFFNSGVFITQDTENIGGFSNYKIVPWENIANALELRIDTSFSPRDLIPALCDTFTYVDTNNIDTTNFLSNYKMFSSLNIYPNPVENLVYFEQGSNSSQIRNITIYNYLGEAIFQENRNLNTPISVQYLEPGLYIIRVDNKITRFVKK